MKAFGRSSRRQAHQHLKLRESGLQVVIDDDSIKFRLGIEFGACSVQTALNRLSRFSTPPADATLKLLETGGRQEDLQRFGERFPHLTGTLQFDFEQNRSTCSQPFFDGCPWSAVAVTGEFSPLQEATAVDQGIEILATLEEVVHPVLLTCSWSPCGGRHR